MSKEETDLSIDMSITSPGQFSVSERDGVDEHGDATSITQLVDVEANIEFHVGMDADVKEEGINIRLSSYHVKNDETERVFHSALEVTLPWEEVKRLRLFLEFLLAARAQ